jgi:alpha-L-fucosidase 2
VLAMLLSPARTYPNLFDAHPPFQIDGNFGGTAGITEMLLQSWGGSIFLLPALPGAWADGNVRGLRVRGAAGVDLEWARGLLRQARITSDRGGRYRFDYRGQELALDLAAGQSATLEWRGGRLVRA